MNIIARVLFGAPYPRTNPWQIHGTVEQLYPDVPIWIVRSEDARQTGLLIEARWAFGNLTPYAREWRSDFWRDPFSRLSFYCYEGTTAAYIVLWDCPLVRDAIPINMRDAFVALRRYYPHYLANVPHPREDNDDE